MVQFRIIYEKKFFLLYHIFIGDHKERAHLSAGGGIRQRESPVYGIRHGSISLLFGNLPRCSDALGL